MEDGGLSPADPTRVAFLLNFSVFCHETMQQKEQALQMATEAYESAMLEIGALDKSKAQEAANVLEFIRENIQIWNQNAGGQKKSQAQHQKNLFS